MFRVTKYAHVSRIPYIWDNSIKASNSGILTEIRVRPQSAAILTLSQFPVQEKTEQSNLKALAKTHKHYIFPTKQGRETEPAPGA